MLVTYYRILRYYPYDDECSLIFEDIIGYENAKRWVDDNTQYWASSGYIFDIEEYTLWNFEHAVA